MTTRAVRALETEREMDEADKRYLDALKAEIERELGEYGEEAAAFDAFWREMVAKYGINAKRNGT